MNISVYNTTLDLVAQIGGMYNSFYWQENYNTTGTFTLELPASDYLKSKIRNDYFIKRNDRDAIMIIKSIQSNDKTLIISGKTAEYVLNDVAFVGKIDAESEISDTLVSHYHIDSPDCQYKYPNVNVIGGDMGDTYPIEVENKSFLELHQIMCGYADIGIKAIKNNNGHDIDIKLYKPAEKIDDNGRSKLVLSPERGNILLPALNWSTLDCKNYAIVIGEYNGREIRVDVDLTDGKIRKEIIIEASDVKQENGENEDEYRARLSATGVEKLYQQKEILNVIFNPPTQAFGKLYDLGDILTVNLNEYHIQVKARVTKYALTEQIGKTIIDIGVGQIRVTRRN